MLSVKLSTDGIGNGLNVVCGDGNGCNVDGGPAIILINRSVVPQQMYGCDVSVVLLSDSIDGSHLA